MSPDMLTLVAAVLAYDRARETCERMSSFSEFRYVMSETSEEKDMAEAVRKVSEIARERRGLE